LVAGAREIDRVGGQRKLAVEGGKGIAGRLPLRCKMSLARRIDNAAYDENTYDPSVEITAATRPISPSLDGSVTEAHVPRARRPDDR
jgi:hypothetical protein